MARTLFPHHRHINFDAALYAALNQAALWRRVSLSAYVRDAVEIATRAEYAQHHLQFPVDYVAVLPGQETLFPPFPPTVPSDPGNAGHVPPPGPTAQRVTDPEDQAALRGFLAIGRHIGPLRTLTDAIAAAKEEASE